MGRLAKPVTIRGVEYRSSLDAAKAIGVSVQTVRQAVSSGTLDNVGLGPRKLGDAPTYGRATNIANVLYPSRTAAAKALGVTISEISSYIKIRNIIEKGTKL